MFIRNTRYKGGKGMFSMFNNKSDQGISVNAIEDLIGKVELIDIREYYEFVTGSIRTAKNIPMNQLLSQPAYYLDKSKKYYIMCQSGMRSKRTVNALQKLGYQAIDVKGGIGAYKGKHRK